MKIISLEIKSVGIGKFFPKEDQLELDISFNDGADKQILKVVDISDSEGAAEGILAELRKMEKSINKNNEGAESIVDSFVNIVIKNEDDALKEIAGFVEKAGNIINEIKSKNVAEGYLDIIRELKGLKLDMIQDS
tara:strand:+ start:5722 stop:6126 length:405 start_codon:yes stop_codon:yes gene_type:complete